MCHPWGDVSSDSGAPLVAVPFCVLAMTDIDRIISLKDVYLENNGLDQLGVSELVSYLQLQGALGRNACRQLRKLLRRGLIPNARQLGGKGFRWCIGHSNYQAIQSSSSESVGHQAVVADARSCCARVNSLAPVADCDSEILIMGTLPGRASLRVRQYYADHRNHFWAIVAGIFNATLPAAYNDRLELLRNRHVALWDVLKFADREGSKDNSIKNSVANDILGFINSHPMLRVIALNGGAASRCFASHVDLRRLPKYIRIVTLQSSSSNNRISVNEKIRDWKRMLG